MAIQNTFTHNYKSTGNTEANAYWKVEKEYSTFDPIAKRYKTLVSVYADSASRQAGCTPLAQLTFSAGESWGGEFDWYVMEGLAITDIGDDSLTKDEIVAHVYTYLMTETDFHGIDLTTSQQV
jgi:hypothetical protein